MNFTYFWTIDFAPLLAALLVGACCAISGSLLLARNQSMSIDGISHMVLPGMVLAFLLSGSASFFIIFWGALVAAVLGMWLVEVLAVRHNRSAVLGMVFCAWFSLGIFLLEVFIDQRVHFDVSHILFGSLESIYWAELGLLKPYQLGRLLASLPMDMQILAGLLVVMSLLFIAFYKEIKLVAFDYSFARSSFSYALLIRYGISLFITATVVAAFRIVGLILILGMFIVPPLLGAYVARSLSGRVLASLLFVLLVISLGYALAVHLPGALVGESFSFNLGASFVVAGSLLLFLIIYTKERVSRNEK